VRILLLGGTSFVGRAIAEQALSVGHELTLFSRGRTGTDLFPGVERRTGDRSTGDYAGLAEGDWDAVVDVSGYVPRHVQQAAGALDGRVGRCLLISTGSVYDRLRASDVMTEDAPRLPAERGTEQVTGDTYGPLKVACEDDVTARYGERATIVRPGVVAGPHDPTDRFTYWVRRAAAGGPLVLAGRPEQPVQVVDSRDLAVLVVQLLEQDRPGTYNAVGPAEPVTLAGLVHVCAAAAGRAVEPVVVDPGAVDPPLPLVLPDPSWDVMFRRSSALARAAGLPGTPLETTAADVLAWDRGRGQPPLEVGLSPEREQELLGGGRPPPPRAASGG
jgi:2'-hydroxyisoflavone reductase